MFDLSTEQLTSLMTAYTPRVVGALSILFFFWLAGVVVRRVFRRLAKNSEAGRKDILILIGQAAKLTLLLFGLVSALGTLGINVSAVVAGLGLTGFALGFAFKDVLSNAVSGVLLLFYQPFRRGDRIRTSGFEGVVSSIDLRYTRLETDGDSVLIPNTVLFTKSVRVISATDSEDL